MVFRQFCAVALSLWLSNAIANSFAFDHSHADLLVQGTEYQLQGDYAKAAEASRQLKIKFPDSGVGQAFELSTLVTRLSWDVADTQFDDQLESEAKTLLELCKQKIKAHPDDAQGYHLCGQAHFALTFLYSVRGAYFRAGRNASLTITRLERALSLAPDLVDAKMHLGITYYYADNLPSFVRAISRLLPFVPTGNSDKSLPYLKAAAHKGLHARGAAKFLYADLVMGNESKLLPEAGALLADLVDRYPSNRRFQLKYIAYWAQSDDYERVLETAERYIARKDCCELAAEDLNLARLWQVNAYLALGNTKEATRRMTPIVFDVLPTWGRGWHEATRMRLAQATTVN